MNALCLALLISLAADQEYRKGLVVCVEPHAAEVGKSILQQGGNAIDAAVATAFALAVTHPEAGNIGGGGFIVAREGRTKEVFTVDFREMAPKAATPTMFLDSQGNIDRGKSGFGWLVVGVPGSPMGLWAAHQKAGKLPWKTVVDPAVKLAADGFPLDDYLVRAHEQKREALSQLRWRRRRTLRPKNHSPKAPSGSSPTWLTRSN